MHVNVTLGEIHDHPTPRNPANPNIHILGEHSVLANIASAV